MNRERMLSREISVTQIPSGEKQLLPAGTKVMIHQTLGGSYTVQADFGLFRIDGKDGDALGEAAADHTIRPMLFRMQRVLGEELIDFSNAAPGRAVPDVSDLFKGSSWAPTGQVRAQGVEAARIDRRASPRA